MGKAVAQMPEHAENRYTGIEAIAELRMNWQLVRYEMRGYNTTPTPEMAARSNSRSSWPDSPLHACRQCLAGRIPLRSR